jgi:tight adherence protein B
MSDVIVGAGAAAGAGALWWLWRGRRLHRISRERLREEGPGATHHEEEYTVELQPTLRRHHALPFVVGACCGVGLLLLLRVDVVYCVAFGVITGVMTYIIEQFLAAHAALKLEMQLANAIDLMVGALGAGSGLAEAIDSAARESPEPLRSELQEILGRIRYGEAPVRVFEDFSSRVPLETFRLFTFTLAVHGEVGGSLSQTLSTVGRSIRDRIEISRRIRTQATEAQASVIGIVCITYFLGLLMWRTNPANFEEFLKHPIGANLAAGAMILQAIGLLWITKLSQLRF